MEVCFDCPARYRCPDAAEVHWALTGHLLGDPAAVAAWADQVATTFVTTAQPAVATPDLRSAA